MSTQFYASSEEERQLYEEVLNEEIEIFHFAALEECSEFVKYIENEVQRCGLPMMDMFASNSYLTERLMDKITEDNYDYVVSDAESKTNKIISDSMDDVETYQDIKDTVKTKYDN